MSQATVTDSGEGQNADGHNLETEQVKKKVLKLLQKVMSH